MKSTEVILASDDAVSRESYHAYPDMAPQVRPEYLRIKPSQAALWSRIGELWRFRELLYFLVWRDIKVRYKQTILGAAWAILQPVVTMAIFSIFFGRLAQMPSDGLPYPLFSLAALVPWSFFNSGITQASNVLVNNANMLKKIYFPRFAMPLASVIGALVDFGLGLLVLLVTIGLFGRVPQPQSLFLPAFGLLAFVAALGLSLWLSALNVRFRDIRYIVPFLLQAWLFATPVAYPSSLLDEPWRSLYGLNPMTSVVEGFRWALFGTGTLTGLMVTLSCLVALALLVSGTAFFNRAEKTFADVA